MRYLVYILIAANLGFFFWYFVMSPPAQAPAVVPAPVPPGVDTLVLLSERAQDAVLDLQSLPETVDPQAVIVADEMQSPENPATQADDPAPAPAPPQRVCRTVGPFLDKQDATSVFTTLLKQGYIVNVRDGDVREPAGYWVYLPAETASEARRIVADLDTHGMKDYFIGKRNHISLGIFSNKDKAQLRQQKVRSLGYDAVLDQRYRMRDVYWLDIEEGEQPLLGSQLWRTIQAQHTDVRAQRVSCE